MFHDVAPMASTVADADEHELILPFRFFEGFVIERNPFYRIPGMLQKVRTAFLDEIVADFIFFIGHFYKGTVSEALKKTRTFCSRLFLNKLIYKMLILHEFRDGMKVVASHLDKIDALWQFFNVQRVILS
jgi:hypothetical protein